MKNKLFCIIFTITALILCFAVSASAEIEFTPETIDDFEKVESLLDCYATGDVNGNGSVLADDARMILRYSVKLESPDDETFIRADIDGDGVLSANDARKVLRYAVKLDDMPSHQLIDITITQVSCGNDGLAVRFCTSCKKVYSIVKTSSSTEKHFCAWKTIRYPDCKNEGFAQYVCVKCGTVTEEAHLARTTSHTWELSYPNGKSCTEKVPVKKTCTVCGKTKSEYEEPYGECRLSTVTEISATCTEDGVESVKCTHCGSIKSVMTVPSTGHSFDEENSTIIEAPDCTHTGTAVAKCTACDEEKEITLEKTAHILTEEWQEVISPSCTEQGIKISHCELCGNLDEVIPATGHTITSWINVRPASCYETGLLVGECGICHMTTQRDIQQLPHDFDTKRPVATIGILCKEDVTEIYKCLNENCEATDEKVFEKVSCTNEKYRRTTEISEATCAKAAVHADLCDYCNQLIPGTEKDFGGKLNHIFEDNNWVITKKATCTETGVKECECSREGCTEKTTASIPKTTHMADPSKTLVTKEPTCAEQGIETLLCAHCNKPTDSTKKIPKLEHTPATVTEARKDSDPNKHYFNAVNKEYCTVCKQAISKTTISRIMVICEKYNDIVLTFDSIPQLEAGAIISFTLNGTPSNASVTASYGSEKSITVDNDQGVYYIIAPVGFTNADNIIITIS